MTIILVQIRDWLCSLGSHLEFVRHETTSDRNYFCKLKELSSDNDITFEMPQGPFAVTFYTVSVLKEVPEIYSSFKDSAKSVKNKK